VKLTVSTLQLPASRLNIGAAQYNTAALTLDKAVVGLGGCDVAVAASSIYTVYAVVSSNTVYLIASLNSSLPSGFTQARAVGGFSTNASSQIDQVASTPGDLSVAGSLSTLGGMSSPSIQNYIINGNFDFWQRKTTGTTGYIADRFDVKAADSAGRSTDVPSNGLSLYSLQVTKATAGFGYFHHRIESQNTRQLAGKTVTLSFWAKSLSGTSNLYSSLSYANSVDNFSSYTTAGIGTNWGTPSSSWTFYTLTFVVSTLMATNGFNIEIARHSASANDTLYSQFMLNEGTIALPFKRAGGTIGAELQLCQRYYENSSLHPDAGVGFNDFVTSAIHSQIFFKVSKRANAAITVSSQSAVASGTTSLPYQITGVNNYTDGSIDTSASRINGFTFYAPTKASYLSQALRLGWAADAEL